jgi:hypothetical protein
MFDKYIYNGLHFIMKWSGQLIRGHGVKHAKILELNKANTPWKRLIRDQEKSEYLEELKRKL